MTSFQRTLTLANDGGRISGGSQSLVQIYPLDIHRGPIKLNKDRIVLGRSSGCDITIVDDSVSREHAEIRETDQGTMILDLDSTNGISVNGQRSAASTLRSGDCIQLGSHLFRFLADDDLEAQYHATVYSMMTRDGLTGPFNRRYLEETLEREVARCKRHDRPIAVIMIDIDEFKSVNDRFGHAIGDQVLRQVGHRLQEVLREEDVLARYGGEEFAVVMVEADIEQATEIAERCREAIAQTPTESTAGKITVTISLGVTAPRPNDLGSCQELISEADQRLYEAKRAGRNRTVC